MKAIAFTGWARSGKDTAADYLAEKYGFEKVVMSELLLGEMKRAGMPDTKMNRSRMGKLLRERFGKDVVAKMAIEKAKKQGLEKAVFVGPRSVSEIELFRKNLPSFKLVAIEAGQQKRFERRSNQDAQTKEEFLKRDTHDSEEFELGQVIGMADLTIGNNSTINDFKKAIDGLMQKI
jgi:dephospho-CoA kinase